MINCEKVFLVIKYFLGGLLKVACNETTTPTEPKEEFATIVKDIKDINIEIEDTYNSFVRYFKKLSK